MPVQNNQPGAVPPQQRPLTGPAGNMPAANIAPVNAGIPPGMTPQGPQAPMPTDQNAVQPGLARDPQVLAALSIYSLQLQSSNPVEVTSAIAAMESFGPAYRQDVVNAVAGQIMPGGDRMRTLILVDALVRHNATEASDRLMPLLSDTDPQIRQEVSKAFGKLKGVAAPGVGGPQAPGAAPANQPGQALPPGVAPPEVAHIVERLRNWRDMGGAAVELAQLPPDQIVAVANAIATGPHIENERAYDLVSAILAKNVRAPGALDAMRNLIKVDNVGSEYLMKAKLRAAAALIHFGDQRDYPSILKLLPVKYYMSSNMQKILMDQIAAKPELLNYPATTPVLVAMMTATDSSISMVAAGNALSKVKSAQARDALGESPLLSTTTYGYDRIRWALDWLNQHPAPYSPRTIDNLKRLAAVKDKVVSEKAKALLKKAGQ